MAENQLILRCSSPPPNCAICLGTFANRCFSDSCMHQFCFKCLLEWSKIKPECPLCKKPFTRIIHNVKSNDDYDEHVVELQPPEDVHLIDNEEYLFLPLGQPQQSTRHQFHFRTTFTVDTHGEHAIQQMLLTHPHISVSTSGYPTARRRRDTAPTFGFRRSIYIRNLWVIAPPDVTGRYREASPAYFRDCPGARTRLIPWLNRELTALLYENTQLVIRLVYIILDLLLCHHVCSRPFRNMLSEYLDNKTDHFVHEFYSFMRSPFDMIGYDRHVIYTERERSPFVVTLPDDTSDSGHDSDVILVNNSIPQEPVVIDLVDTDSDEPILVSHEDPPPPELIPIHDDSPGPSVRETRSPVLPLKLRLKHKRRSKEEREKRYKLKSHRHRSKDSSSSSSSDSSRKSIDERRRRKKKFKRMKKKVPSGNELNFSSDSDDNVPLTVLINRRKYAKVFSRKTLRNIQNPTKESEDVENSVEDHNLPSCSKYSAANGSLLDLRTNLKREPSVDLEAPSCSKYARLSRSFSFEMNLSQSSSDDYDFKHQVKSEIKTVNSESNGSVKAEPSETVLKSSERIKNIMIKKENSGNSWYTYQRDFSSSENEDFSKF